MNIYLPIAEMSVPIYLFVGMGAAVGFLSGMFGVGGGFLMTPLLILAGIPSPIAVGTEAAQIVASSVSGALAQWRRRNIDIKMGTVLLAGGLVGSVAGVQAVKVLRATGQFDLVITLCYVILLGIVGALMLVESLSTMRKAQKTGKAAAARKPGQHSWIHGLPFKTRFPRSKLYISIIPPVLIGLFIGFLSGIMGVGGGFILVPAMIYLLKMPTNVVVGTSLYQIVFVTAATTIMQAWWNHTVDIVLAILLMVGGVVGAQLGAAAGARLNGEQLRFLMAALVLLVALRMAYTLFAHPGEIYSIGSGGH
jgi:uncharacterized membrane protein YfcA